uniref:R3H domain-containing protein n=1 Tax=Mycena chlorophos TaxID=658473 RepID=A0ABQ0KVA0_MYCCL|nr:predicted protein [Mycena chlorophos]
MRRTLVVALVVASAAAQSLSIPNPLICEDTIDGSAPFQSIDIPCIVGCDCEIVHATLSFLPGNVNTTCYPYCNLNCVRPNATPEQTALAPSCWDTCSKTQAESPENLGWCMYWCVDGYSSVVTAATCVPSIGYGSETTTVIDGITESFKPFTNPPAWQSWYLTQTVIPRTGTTSETTSSGPAPTPVIAPSTTQTRSSSIPTSSSTAASSSGEAEADTASKNRAVLTRPLTFFVPRPTPNPTPVTPSEHKRHPKCMDSGPANPAHPPESTSSGRSNNNNRRNRQRPRDANNQQQHVDSHGPRSAQDGQQRPSRGGGAGGGGRRPPPANVGHEADTNHPRPSNRRGAKFNSGLTTTDAAGPAPRHSHPRVRAAEPVADDLTSRLTAALGTPPYPDCPICFTAIHPAQPTWSCSPEITVLDAPQYCWTTFHLKCVRAWAQKSVREVADAPAARPPPVAIAASAGHKLHPHRHESQHPIRVLHRVRGNAQTATILVPFSAILDRARLVASPQSCIAAARVTSCLRSAAARLMFLAVPFAADLSTAVCTNARVTVTQTLVLRARSALRRVATAARRPKSISVVEAFRSRAHWLDQSLGSARLPALPLATVLLLAESTAARNRAIQRTTRLLHALAIPHVLSRAPVAASQSILLEPPALTPSRRVTRLAARSFPAGTHVLLAATKATVRHAPRRLSIRAAAAEILCEKQCSALRACGRHRCLRVCCPLASVAALQQKAKGKKRATHANENEVAIGEEPGGLHECDLVCGKMLGCGLHRCERRDHKGPCGDCLMSSFEELICSCGLTVLEPPIPCGTVIQCPHPCSRPPPTCGHPRTPHSCHPDSVSCPPCPFLTSKKCMCGKKVVGNVRCSQERVGCGAVCGKVLACGAHTCERVCHAPEGVGDDGGCGPCSAPCGKPRRLCHPGQHPCTAPCHAPSACDESTPCTAVITVSCPCLRIRQQVQCGKSTANPAGRREQAIKCTNDCLVAKRNARLAEALGITAESRDKLAEVTWSDEVKAFGKVNGRFVGVVEKAFADFVNSDKKTQVLPHMPPERRKFVHDVAANYRMDTQMVDQEPHRSVRLLKRYDTKVPSPLLSSVLGIGTVPAPSGGLGKLADLSKVGGSWRAPSKAVEVAKPVASAPRGWGQPPTPAVTPPPPPVASTSTPPPTRPGIHVPLPAARVVPPAATPTAVPEDWEDDD